MTAAQIDLAIAYLCFLHATTSIGYRKPAHWELLRPNCRDLEQRCKLHKGLQDLFQESLRFGWTIGHDYSGDHDDCNHSTKYDLWGLIEVQKDLMTLEAYLSEVVLPLQTVMRRVRDASSVLRNQFPYGTRQEAGRFHGAFERFLSMLASGELTESDLLNPA
ncbi:hypothetical protein EDM68_03845 [Candidatus Uhrbacteria bacterium]|nr:MAG: hypothetical protein EDM68_03845 [Candidatus Uhrbacteria bacterium]